KEMSREDALSFMEKMQEPYKMEMIQGLPEGEKISFYRQGDYVEFCAGPHISNTCQVKAIKLLSVAGAYWRGDEKNPVLTRIYGISFPKASELARYLNMLEEAKKRDHRKLGKELGLFALMEEGPGLPFFLPKGLILKNLLIDYWRKIHDREGYVEISTPIMLNKHLWETSGHWDNYRENMYTLEVDEEEFAIKPMSCPGGMLVYKSQPHSYRDLPMRVGELGIVHRNEKSGTLHGLMRARCFQQDDAHIFMTQEQVIPEIVNVARLIDEVYKKFGFEYAVELSTRPENSIGSDEDWELATEALAKAMESINVPYVVNEGDGAFYGPKLDFHLKDSIGRTWQCGTIQLDFQLPQRFGAEYIGADGEKHRPIMIHRVLFGSIERFIGILIEHFAGKFPAWLAPVQVKLLPVSDKYLDYAQKVMEDMKAKGIRVEIDKRSEKLGYKIREARMDKVPFMAILGEKEQANGTISVRMRDAEEDKQDLGEMKIEELLKLF
ncbi:MAG: threonine--tRNA ligase, partial [Lachnospiraceae bacterium]|nr:threonine--tRNA ligase [Lachnospiraceae bacterium]